MQKNKNRETKFMTLRQHGLSDLHLDFRVFFSNKYFGRKFRSKVLSQEDYD